MKRMLTFVTVILVCVTVSVSAEEYDIDGFLQCVEQHSKQLKLAAEDVKSAHADKKEAVSGALPQVSARAGYTRNLSDTYMYLDMAGEGDITKLKINKNNEYRFGATVSQTLFSPTVHYAISAAKQYEKLTDFIYDASYQEIITVARSAFHQTLLLKIVWDVSAASEQNALENYTDMQQRFSNGLISEFDLLQAEVRYRDKVPQTTEARRNYEIALISLKNLAGIPVEEEMTVVGELAEYPVLPDEADLMTVLQRRPDYNALLTEEQLRGTNIKIEQAAYYPSLSGSLSYGYSAQSDEWRLDDDNNSWTAGLNLSIPIFSGGRTRAKVTRAKIEVDKTRLRVEQAREDVQRELASIRLSMIEAHGRIEAASATLTTARKAFDIAEATAKVGLATQLQLKDSRLMLDQATVNYHGAVLEYLVAYFEWEKAVGLVRPEKGTDES